LTEHALAILCGGLGTRLRPITDAQPKALVDVGGVPFLARVLRRVRACGFARVVLCTGYGGDAIAAAVGSGTAFGLQIGYSHDGERPLGTGGALVNALPLLGERFVMLYGDTFPLHDLTLLATAFARSAAPAMMAVAAAQWSERRHVAVGDGRVVDYRKDVTLPGMTHRHWGASAFRAQAFSGREPGTPFDLADTFGALVTAGSLAAYEVYEPHVEIGSHGGLAAARRRLLPGQRGLE